MNESHHPSPLRVTSLFSGIGGFELGLKRAGHETVLMCESDEFAQTILRDRFPNVEIADDITKLAGLPDCDLITAGWPCQDISQAGQTRGLEGSRSGLISEVFRLISEMPKRPRYVLLENVAFALDLRKGEAVRYVTDQLSALGYKWAYRILNTQLFGVPQRRRRLFVLGALDENPDDILLSGIASSQASALRDTNMVGFYWTEGNRGVGWSPGAVPPLKGGSGLGIPSPPAVWQRDTSSFVTPGIEDAERLQGFPPGWTAAASGLPRGERKRWLLVGNAVSVPVVEWIGRRLGVERGAQSTEAAQHISTAKAFAKAGTGGPDIEPRFYEPKNEGPEQHNVVALDEFGLRSPAPLSQRAAAGFTRRFEVAPLRKDPDFLRDLRLFLTPEAAT